MFRRETAYEAMVALQGRTIEALQAEVTTLRTALEEAAGLFNEMHLPLQGHAATRCTLRTDFCVTAEHVREARRNADC